VLSRGDAKACLGTKTREIITTRLRPQPRPSCLSLSVLLYRYCQFYPHSLFTLSPTMLDDIVIEKLWLCLTKLDPSMKNKLFNFFLKQKSDIEDIAEASKISNPASLPDFINGPRPEDASYFKSLRAPIGDEWIVYGALMEKAGYPSRLQIGSATCKTYRNVTRMRSYRLNRLEKGKHMPVHMAKAIDEGFVITHVGVLVSAPRPVPSEVPLTRLVFYGLEGTFAFLFWSMQAYKSDYSMAGVTLWGWQNLPWKGLSSHTAFADPICGEFDLTKEELEEHAANMKVRKQEQNREKFKRIRADPVKYQASIVVVAW
jgi:hypothetical protein